MLDALAGGFSVRLLYRLILLPYFSLCVLVALLAPFPAGFDEHAHFSWVAHVSERPELTPSFNNMFLVGLDDRSAWITQRNYY